MLGHVLYMVFNLLKISAMTVELRYARNYWSSSVCIRIHGFLLCNDNGCTDVCATVAMIWYA